ncbi:preprotein translocase subunit SecA [Pseudodonghicola flavimaris]|uniref:Protein translocase subunit SecA n=1 Tax=Pseudodonghicola flavimaris TaxID=3050036 RepID=A0ABT7F0C0_9RHOB|nr:preprotein translocase subunit SecA [Pseudodonghicola flavimaris]MDK3018040.1 preprotein translocase subunit SecA [Pseudodonghicola flavimaris]
MSDSFPAPAAGSFYPRAPAVPKKSKLDHWVERFTTLPRRRLQARPTRMFARRVLRHGRRLTGLSDAELQEEVRATAHALRAADGRPREALLVRSFAVIRECAGRELGLRHYATQILGARAVLNGAVAEMQTGEGKTLAITLAAGAAALAGRRVHVITANDYLAGRDAETMRGLYARLGLSCAAVVPDCSPEERRAAFAADIVYASGKEVAFTFLRDRVAMGGRAGDIGLRTRAYFEGSALLLPGLQFAIVDEIDSVMIDEARTPLILSVPPADAEVEADAARAAHAIASEMKEGRDYRLDRLRRQVDLTAKGCDRLEERAAQLPPAWRPAPIREDALRTAISAIHLHRRDEHYILRDGKVEIVDEYTGRVMPDRSWSAGLHQAVEAKEGVEITSRRITLAQITFQRFFRRYIHLGGMTGTATEAADEFWSVYDLPVVRIPTHKPPRRRTWRPRVSVRAAAKWARVAARARALSAQGRPVLIGTRTVAASEAASAALTALGVAHRVLSAAQDADEAAVIAAAGRAGAVTVATNMAGRGTDILLDEAARAAGGLHVIMTERHSASRIDRQLAGRAGRQGDPGSTEAILSAEDSLLAEFGGRYGRFMARLGGPATLSALSDAQRRAERSHIRARRRLLELDEQMAENLAFTGTPE